MGKIKTVFVSDLIFTPFCGELIDQEVLEEKIKIWISPYIRPDISVAGGAIVTGLASLCQNSAIITQLIEKYTGDAVIATADDSQLEAWLSFMGSCLQLSKNHPEIYFLNFDIGGGTTKVTLGKNGQCLKTGYCFIGARHLQFSAGTYEMTKYSAYGKRLLEFLKIKKTIGQTLNGREVELILDFYMHILELIAQSRGYSPNPEYAELIEPQLFLPAESDSSLAITFSGGVGELIYADSSSLAHYPITFYGDLGVALAQRISESKILSAHIKTIVPPNKGRATLYGLTLFSTKISGTTMFLPQHPQLPIRNVPMVGQVSADFSTIEAEIQTMKDLRIALELASDQKKGACLQICTKEKNVASIKKLGKSLAQIRQKLKASDSPLIILIPDNFGKTLGNYLTSFVAQNENVFVIDEIALTNANFVNIGRLAGQVLPVSFYGLFTDMKGDTYDSKSYAD